MIVSINQPAYLPWLGYFERIYRSDVHVVLDHVQFEKNSFINRNKIRTSKDNSTWLTIPVKTKGKFGQLWINELEIANNLWQKKHLSSIRSAYGKAPFFKEHAQPLLEFYEMHWCDLNQLLKQQLQFFLDVLGIKTRIVYSSELNCTETKSDLVLSICKSIGASTYLSGALGRNYLDEKDFQKNNVKVTYQDYQHPVYEQGHQVEFMPFLSIIDCLFNVGHESLSIIQNG